MINLVGYSRRRGQPCRQLFRIFLRYRSRFYFKYTKLAEAAVGLRTCLGALGVAAYFCAVVTLLPHNVHHMFVTEDALSVFYPPKLYAKAGLLFL
jgi:hypothetical protein